MKSLEESVLVMESLAESILVMKKQREQLKREKENLTRMLKNARQRYTRLKKKAHPLACDDLVDELITGSDACDMSVDCEPTAAPAAVGKRGDDLLMSF
jgi:molecular chaperone GrpE (heat shock protein)